jgi:hypothetical protein
MHSFTAYGLTLESEVRLPELEPSRAEPDVQVRLRDVPESPDEPVVDGRLYRLSKGHYVAFEGVGSIFAKDGQTLIVDPADDVPAEILRWLVLGRGFRMLLYQRGYVVLHASAATVDGQAVAFVGDSGQGKSTTVASFYAEGYPVLTDDVTPVDPETADVPPGFQQVKLDQKAAKKVDASLTPNSESNLTRQYYVVPSSFDDESVPLRRIYLLADGSETRIESLPPSERPLHLMRASTLDYQSPDEEGVESHLEDCAQLSSNVPVKRLERPREFDALPDVVNAVEADLSETPQTKPGTE